MDAWTGTWMALCALGFLLGVKHGFDADHLATIDGLTRCIAPSNPKLAKRAGTLFSLGHGSVVIIVAAIVGSVAVEWRTPGWIELTGAAVSVVFLLGLAAINVHAVTVAERHAIVAPAGIRSRLLGAHFKFHGAWVIAVVGALFALSFDTLSAAALFALAATRFDGVASAVILSALFMTGMMLVDGVNGLWISRLIQRADRTAAAASRVMALGIAAISLAVGLFTLAKMLFPAAAAWAQGRDFAFGALVVAAAAASFVLSVIAARPRRVRTR